TMMKLMDNHACCVCEFVEIFQFSQPAVSQHLRKLKDLGLVVEERKGQWIFYSVNKNNEYYSFIQPILDQIPSQDYKIKELEEKRTRINCRYYWRYYLVNNAYTRDTHICSNPRPSDLAPKRFKYWVVCNGRSSFSSNCRSRRV